MQQNLEQLRDSDKKISIEAILEFTRKAEDALVISLSI